MGQIYTYNLKLLATRTPSGGATAAVCACHGSSLVPWLWGIIEFLVI